MTTDRMMLQQMADLRSMPDVSSIAYGEPGRVRGGIVRANAGEDGTERQFEALMTHPGGAPVYKRKRIEQAQ